MRIPSQQKIDKYLGYFLIILLMPITRVLGILLRIDHKLSKPPENILFIKILGLGSLVTASDAIKGIKQKHPDAKLILITDSNIAEGIQPFHLFDEIWKLRSGNILLVSADALKFLFKTWKLKKLWIVDLEVYSKLTTVYSLLTFAINRFGFYLSPVFFRKYLNTHNVFFNRLSFLENNYLEMAASVTAETFKDNSSPVIRKNKNEMSYIALNNTCSDLAFVRKLPESSFADICIWLLKYTSYKIALLGMLEDRNEISDFIEHHPRLFAQKERILNYAGVADFTSYYRFLADECICMISIDSAPLHIAKKLGVPTVSIWGPTNPGNYLKIYSGEKDRHLVYYDQVVCSPCIHHFEKLPCNGNNFCMKNIPSEQIIEKVKVLLKTITSS